MASASTDMIERRSVEVCDGVEGFEIEDGGSIPGAGSVPGVTIPTRVVRLPGNADDVWSSLAQAPIPVVATRRDGAVYLDLRSVPPGLDGMVAAAVRTATS
jgi:hypothetical protein